MLPKMDVKGFVLFGFLLCILQTACCFNWQKVQVSLRESPRHQGKQESLVRSIEQLNELLTGRPRKSHYKFIKNNDLKSKSKYDMRSQKMQNFLRKLHRKKLKNASLLPTEDYMSSKWSRFSPLSTTQYRWTDRSPASTKTANLPHTSYRFPTTSEITGYKMPKPANNFEPEKFIFGNAHPTNAEDLFIELPQLSDLSFPSLPQGKEDWFNLETVNDNPDSVATDILTSGSFGNHKNNGDTIPVPVSKSTGSWGEAFSPIELSDLNFGSANLNSGFDLDDALASSTRFSSVPEPPGGFGYEGSFVTDTSGCEDIDTKTCTTDKDCSCNGFYVCSNEKCQTISSQQSDLGAWGDGPIDIGSFSSKKHLH